MAKMAIGRRNKTTFWEQQYRPVAQAQRLSLPSYHGSMQTSASVTTLLFAGALVCQSSGAMAAPALPAGTLPIPRAIFATSGIASVSTAGKSMTINQQSQRAILNWDSFNIASDSSVQFNQPGATAVALNRIFDANPSVIQGQLKANGQVYLINRNGIIFDKGSQTNVNTLIASTLDVNDALFNNGILSATTFGPVFQQNAGDPAGAQVIVETGARIQTDSGGRVLLLGPSVINRGEIRTPDGQTILAAGNKVYLRTSEDLNLRGFLVEVDTGLVAPDAAKAAVNEGSITAERGNISMVGLAVRQSGTLTATTSTGANGSIVLNARDGGAGGVTLKDPRRLTSEYQLHRAGTVNVTAGSLTQVNIDSGDKAGIDANVTFNRSQVNVNGKKIVVEGSIVAPSGNVTLTVVADPSTASVDPSNPALAKANDSRIYLANGSNIDVSGTRDTVLPMSSNLLTVELRGDELKDFPIQRDGILRGQKVVIDVNKGTTVADVSKLIAAVPRGIGEISAAGGTVNMVSEGDIVMQQQATINVSGGKVAYESGSLYTSKLVSQGRVYDISTASPDRDYDALLNAYNGTYSVQVKKWGVTLAYDIGKSLLRDTPGYVKGASAGSVNIKAHGLALDGNFLGGVVAGLNQRETGSIPTAGLLSIADYDKITNATKQTRTHDVVLQASAVLTAPRTSDDVLPQEQPLVLSTNFITEGGFSRLTLDRNGSIEVPRGVDLNLPAGGSVSITGIGVNVGSNISAPGGAITLQTRTLLDRNTNSALVGPLVVNADSTLSTRGLWVNDLPAVAGALGAGGATGPVVINGGSITLNAESDLLLGQVVGDKVLPAVLDVGGGGWINASGAFKAGNGGNLTLGGSTLTLGGSDLARGGGIVQLAAVIRALAPGTGGTLTVRGGTLTAKSIADDPGVDVIIRDGAPNVTAKGLTLAAGDIARTAANFPLPAWMFDTLGFTKYVVRASGNLTVAKNTELNLIAPYLSLTLDARLKPTGSDISTFTQVQALPEIRRPVSLTLAPLDARSQQASITIAAGARIRTDAAATVDLSANTNMLIDGRIDAPAGTISLAINALNGVGYSPAQSIWLGAQSALSATGSVKLAPDTLGRRIGSVSDGGSVNITANRGTVVTEAGSRIDVSGTNTELDMLALNGARARVPVASNAGSISITAAESMLLDGDLAGHAGGAGTAGGSLALSITARNRADPDFGLSLSTFPSVDRVLTLRGGDSTAVPVGLKAGQAIQRSSANDLNGLALINVNKITRGGLAQFSAKSDQNIRFADNVVLNAPRSVTLDAPGIVIADNNVTINTSYAAIGSSDPLVQSAPLATATTAGTLAVNANLIDLVGHVAVSGAASVKLIANGDIRGRGVRDITSNRLTGAFSTGGALELAAAQVYPTTFSQFAITSVGDMVINPNTGDSSAPLSAGGNLQFAAPNITVNGTLRAPFGSLELNAANTLTLSSASVTSVSGAGQLVPFGNTQNGLDWVFSPAVSTNLLIDAPPEKAIKLSGKTVQLSAGATVDLSGGGNLYAYEFVPGPGGSKDALDNAVNGNALFALLPTLKSAYAPFDQQYYTGSTLKPGDSVYLSGGGGLAAGAYALLPARYALLPGAFLIGQAAGVTAIVPGQNVAQVDGTPVIAGFRTATGTDARDNRWIAYAIKPGSAGRSFAEYRDNNANDFFAARAVAAGNVAPPSPADAGRLEINAAQNLTLAGARLLTVHDVGARGAEVDITSTRLAIVSSDATDLSGLSDYVRINAADLSALNAESLLLGGTRAPTTNGIDIRVGAQDVVVANSAANPLRAPEVIMAANNTVTVRSGATVEGVGSRKSSNISIGYKFDAAALVTDAAQTVRRDISGDGKVDSADNIDGRGALLRVSGGEQVRVLRENVIDRTRGTLLVHTSARVNAERSLILDATNDTQVQGLARIGAGTLSRDTNGDGIVDANDNRIGGEVSLSAGLISAGDTASANAGRGVDRGLVLSNALLEQLRGVNTLSLRSYSSIDLYGATQLGAIDSLTGKPFFTTLELSGAGIGGYNNAATISSIAAATVRFNNADGSALVGTPDGTGKLTIAADRVILGVGDKTISGFANVDMAARAEIRTEGNGSTKVAATLVLDAPRLTADVASRQTLSAERDNGTAGVSYFSLLISKPNLTAVAPVPTPADSVAAQLTLAGASILHNGLIDLPGGTVTLSARGAGGDVRLGAESAIQTRGVARMLAGVPVNAPAGNVTVVSEQGNVRVDAGAAIDVSGNGHDAGHITVSAANGVAAIQGNFAGHAPSGFLGGGFTLDARYVNGGVTQAVNDFTALNGRLNTGGFTTERAIRLRKGDITVASGDTISASTLKLISDDGRIDVLGTIDARGSNGGKVQLAARGDVTLGASGALLANANAEGGSGGDVTASTVSGQVVFAAGSQVNVSKYVYQPDDINVTAAGTVPVAGGTVSAYTANLLTAPTAYTQGMNVVFRASDNSRGTSTLAVDGLRPTAIKRSDGTNLAVDDIRTGDIVKLTFDGTYFRMPAGEKGNVLLRAPRNAAGNDIALTALGAIAGAREIVGEGVKIYAANTISSSADSATNFSTAATSKANVEAADFVVGTNFNSRGVRRRLSSSVADAFHVRPGVEVQSTGDLTVSGTAWNLLTWRYNGEPGILTARAAGNISINTSISDGFSLATTAGILRDTLSWSYRFTSGADLKGASPAAVLPLAGGGALAVNAGNLSVAATALVRTGTGSIDLASGRDFVLGKSASGPNLPTAAVYTAGRPSEIFPTSGASGFPTTNLTTASYPTSGGDLTLSAQQDIFGAVSPQLISAWLVRRAGTDPVTGAIVSGRNTAWGIDFAKFQQNTGALGGGDVSVSAGRDISNLSVMLPTTGRLIGAAGSQPDTNNLVVTGGGNLNVSAGGDLRSGVYYVGRGVGTLHADGSIVSGRTVGDSNPNAGVQTSIPIHTILALGDGRFDVRAAGGARLETVLNPTVVALDSSVVGANRNYFFTYSSAAAVKIDALSGDVILNNNPDAIKASAPGINFSNVATNNTDINALTVYPGKVDAYAALGDIKVASSFTLYPSARGNLQMIAGGSVNFGLSTSGSNVVINLSDADPALLLNPLRTPFSGGVFYNETDGRLIGGGLPRNVHALTPIHQQDENNPVRIVAAAGSIAGGQLYFSKPAEFYAGTDVRDIQFEGQNLRTSDVTSIVAGRDVSFATPRNTLTGEQQTNDRRIVLGGSGRLEIEAGRNIDLGNSRGVVTRANILNPALSPLGADVTLATGISSTPGYGAFVEKYFDANEKQLVANYVRTLMGDNTLSDGAAFAAFDGLSRTQQLAAPFMSNIRIRFYNELTQSGREAILPSGNYQRGFGAIATLFPGTAYRGDLSLLFSQIKTESGGRIDILVPGGRVNAGQTTPPAQSGSTKGATELGVLVFDDGAVHAFSKGDFAVNESRVFTLKGGDILIWSSEGDIDAGRGAKTAVSAPPPILVTDSAGNTSFKFNAVSGSGIRSILTRADIVPGSVDLIAPSGTVNAGDAGIGAAGNLNIAALRVVGADNIQVSGKSSGVPLSDTGSAGRGLAGLGNTSSDATRSVDQATRNLGGNAANENLRPGFISVEVLSIGN